MPSRNYQDLIAWQKSMDLVHATYEISRLFPKEEIYGLTSQIRRAVVSIPSNIAEGEGRKSDKEFHRFLGIAHGSLREVETQLLIAERLGFVSKNQITDVLELATEIGRIIQGLINSLRAKIN